ncbi:squalene synthetase-like protein [Coniothyrium glycines]
MSRKKGKTKGKASAKSPPRKPPSKRHAPQPLPVRHVREPITPKFSLADEARWMSNHRTAAFEAGKKLRHMPVHFISAGHLEGTIKERKPAAGACHVESEEESSLPPSSPMSLQLADNTHAMAHMAIRSPSPASSQASSSADEVVFKGRAQISQQSPATAFAKTTMPERHIAPVVVLDGKDAGLQSSPTPAGLVVAAPKSVPSTTKNHAPHTTDAEATASIEPYIRAKATVQTEPNAQSDSESITDAGFSRRRGGKPAWEGATTPWEHRSKPGIGWLPVRDRPSMDAFVAEQASARDAALDDYLQNMEDFGLTDDLLVASGFAQREMDLDAGSHNDWESASEEDGGHDQGEERVNDRVSWDSDMLRDLDEISTSSEAMETVACVLSKRVRKSGLHYLCVYHGSSVDDARWLPATLLRNRAERRLVQAYEQEASRREQRQTSDSASTDNDDDEGGKIEEDDEDDEDDEEEEEEEEEEDFDDETIARVLQKQEELGLGSDEVLLYAGHEFFTAPPESLFSFEGFGRSTARQRVRVRNTRSSSFPSASAMADALAMDPYGGFDIMDTERPSLKQKKKGRRGQMPPELEDEDLNDQLQSTWAADRDKKRLKKVEREELRQQGLLGRKGRGANLKVKYDGGISMEDIVEEIREFLMGDMQTLSLPPMEASRRATVHQAAASFNLTSRSRGDGHDRFTVLAKTIRTRAYTDAEFDVVIQRRGFQKRLRGPLYGSGNNHQSRAATIRHSNRVRPRISYQDGDTVGANAPELGPENKGHALLSKMGWSKGTGLGALDNKGILQPIAHTVKTNKAGLQ